MMQFEPIQFQTAAPSNAPLLGKRVRAFIPQAYGKNHEPEVLEELPPPPPTFSEQELEAAKKEAHRKGFIEGEAEGKKFAESEIAMIEKQTHELIVPIAEQVLALFTHYNNFVLSQKSLLPQLALAIAKRSSKIGLTEEALAHVEQVSTNCIERMLGVAELHIFVHPTLSDALEHKLTHHFAGSHEVGDVLIHKDELLAPGACRVEWQHGGLEYSPATFWQEMDSLMSRLASAEVQTHEEITAASTLQAYQEQAATQAAEPQAPADEADNATTPETSDNPKE